MPRYTQHPPGDMLRPKVLWKKFDDAYADRVTTLEQWAVLKSEGKLRPEDLYIPTGLRKWDANGGVTRGVLTVLGGVDGQGKSFVKKHLATSAAKVGLRVAMIDFEDPEAKTMDREIAANTRIDSRRLGLATFDPMDLDLIFASLDDVRKWGKNITAELGTTSQIAGSRGKDTVNILPKNVLATQVLQKKMQDGDIIYWV